MKHFLDFQMFQIYYFHWPEFVLAQRTKNSDGKIWCCNEAYTDRFVKYCNIGNQFSNNVSNSYQKSRLRDC